MKPQNPKNNAHRELRKLVRRATRRARIRAKTAWLEGRA
jgi:hypothetical protein